MMMGLNSKTTIVSILIVSILAICLIDNVEARIKPTSTKYREQYYRNMMGEAPNYSNETYWFEQLQDHFDSSNTNTWKQQYQVYQDGFDGTGPIFVFLAGEASVNFFTFQEVQIVNWVKEFNAVYIVIEHRFYGESYPTPDLSTFNLKFLTSQQALADAANIITTYQKENNLQNNKVVVFGCSYSGALSAWFRLKYPEIAVASVAPSGPVEAQLNFTGFYGKFSYSAEPNCVAAAQNASQQIMQMIQTFQGRQQLSKIFNSCSDLEDPYDLYYFIYAIVDTLGSSDQMNNPPTWLLNQTCETLTSNSNVLQNWATIFDIGQPSGCNDFRMSSFLNSMREEEISQQDGSRAWTFQTCLEFGYFSSTYEGTSVFPPVLYVEEQVRWCEEIFGVYGMTPNINFTNNYYGGKDIPSTNIAFTNGNLDPWSLLSVTENNADNSVLGITYQAGHCGSLIQETDIDPVSLVNAREEVVAFLKSVLSDSSSSQ
ncbi:hypothetical protein DLAC_04533 [Tieghemostelium lacteum]|uniref:Peptidase S28 family protein n=1 Tax=Tieghemostelium lacteum TaxID=361077 RepID=A0A151ZK09_TIELA|nr:hypothetical protein DLAC_04533 [Tieghemostelium lacteum]|eukprot:KYQ94239.1 hypothetical protein DLAC_04533 [Tieghemostelium lacteum]